MNKKVLRSMLKNLAEQKAPANQVNLWPAIQTRVQMGHSNYSKGTIMEKQTNPLRWQLRAVYLFVAIIVISASFLMFPQGRALGQELLHFFTRGETNVMPGVTVTPVKWVEQTRGVSLPTSTPIPATPTVSLMAFEQECGPINTPHCSVEDIRQRVNFPVYGLAQSPAGMNFAGATGGPGRAVLVYTTPDQSGSLVIFEDPFEGSKHLLAGEVGADAVIQSLAVGSVMAEYVQGNYDGNQNPPVWNNDLDTQMMRWVDHDVLFTFYLLGMKAHLGASDMVALAETLTSGPVSSNALSEAVTKTPTPEPTVDMHAIYPLTLAEAEAKAEHHLLLPGRLPETLSFLGGKYDGKSKIVTIIYTMNLPGFPEAQGGLIVSEQLAPEGIECDLCGFVQGDGTQVAQYPQGKLVSTDANIETVQAGKYSGQYVEGIGWVARDNSGVWQWEPDAFRKRMRLRVGDRAIEVWADMNDLSKADFLAIVASLK
jgi:hypothetical protein